MQSAFGPELTQLLRGVAREANPQREPQLFEKLKLASEQKYGMWMPPQPEHVSVEVKPRKVLAWLAPRVDV